MVAVVFDSVVTLTLFVALCVAANADTDILNARKAENSNIKSLFILPPMAVFEYSQSLLLLLPAYSLP